MDRVRRRGSLVGAMVVWAMLAGACSGGSDEGGDPTAPAAGERPGHGWR